MLNLKRIDLTANQRSLTIADKIRLLDTRIAKQQAAIADSDLAYALRALSRIATVDNCLQ